MEQRQGGQLMNILDAFRGPDGAALVGGIARSAGIDGNQAVKAIESLLPALAYGFERNTLSRGGLADLLKALGDGHHEGYISDPTQIGNPAMVADGNKILGYVIGPEGAVDRAVSQAAYDSGISGSILRSVLPTLAALVMGWLFKGGKGALGDVLSKIPRVDPGGFGSGEGQSANAGGGLPAPVPGGSGNGGGFGGTAGGSGNPGGGPLSMPDLNRMNPQRDRGDNPYGDLGDVLQRGGGGSGPLGQIVRNIFGGMLGFGNKGGIVSWIIRFIIMRWGWQILSLIVRRVLTGR